MKSLLSGWKSAQRSLQPPRDALWLFDYDGTLTPIVSHPDRAVLSPEMRGLLRRLAERYPRRVGVLSGRPADQVRRRVRIPQLIYGGVHGYDIQGPGFRFQHAVSPQRQAQLQNLGRKLRSGLAGIPGPWVENKRWTLAVHHRQLRPQDRARVEALLDEAWASARRDGFRVQKGLKLTEFFADNSWNKGWAVRWLRRRLKARRVFYIGDDATDETVFHVLGPSDVSVRVGPAAGSQAAYQVRRQRDVAQILRRVLAL